MTVRSKHNNLLNYFLYDKKDLSKKYIKNCEIFFKEIKTKNGVIKNEKNIKLEETK